MEHLEQPMSRLLKQQKQHIVTNLFVLCRMGII
jgi:hypothetical protein